MAKEPGVTHTKNELQAMPSHGNAEDLYIQMSKHLNCPHCGGSGHVDDVTQPEQEKCKGCNGHGMVGNILDTDTCAFCHGSGIEAQPGHEPVAWKDLTNSEMMALCRDIESRKHSAYDILWEASRRLKARNATPPQRKPLTEQERAAFEAHWYDKYHAGSIHARTDGSYMHPAVQRAWEAWQARAVHGIKGDA